MGKKAEPRRTRKRGPRKGNDKDVADRVIDAALVLAERRGWRGLTLAEIAAEAGVTLAELYAAFASKTAILAAFARRIDLAVLARDDPEIAEQPVRDRLFDVLMRRFDALTPYRPALRVILREGCADPATALCGACALARSMAAMLEAARLDSSGLRGLLRIKGLAAVYLATFRVWLGDDSADQARTMATLDRRLAQAERAIMLCRGFPRPRRRGPAPGPEAPPEPEGAGA